jgi:hypothetical protein
MVDVTA